ncbi:MAG TPA: hypothetical protein VFH54_16800 [Mycobacteriales bacterium]|nr:hypothetical protein [Mycobacteriales bacterium]
MGPDRSAVRSAFAPALADVRASLGFTVQLGFDPDYDIAPDMPGVYIKPRQHSSGCVVSIDLTAPPEAQVAEAAAQLQEVLRDDDQVRVPDGSWPTCPSHAGHSLEAVTAEGRAIWRCPVTSSVAFEIGNLVAP